MSQIFLNMMVSVDGTKSPIAASDAVPVVFKDSDPNSITEVKLELVSDEDVEDSRSTHNSSVSSDQEKNKIYYCQRCLNHNLKFQRKGHKPDCRFVLKFNSKSIAFSIPRLQYLVSDTQRVLVLSVSWWSKDDK